MTPHVPPGPLEPTNSAADGEDVHVGGVTVPRAAALASAKTYLSGRGTYGYPAYDAYDAGSSPWQVTDADLLAPALLNVTPRLPAFYALGMVRPQLEQWLSQIPLDAQLEQAGTDELTLLADLFAVLDGNGVRGVQGTTLAKIMHRKRPAFVPLYDRCIWRCYVGIDGAPIPRERYRHRTWEEFIPLLAKAMSHDLTTEGVWLDHVASQATSAPITRLRALDIVAWQAGRSITVANEPPHHDELDDETSPTAW